MKLPVLTLSVKRHIIQLRDDFKLLSRIAAHSVKSKTMISNVFIYKKRDALKQTLHEYNNIRNLVTVLFDVKDIPYLGLAEHTTASTNDEDKEPTQPVLESSYYN